MTIENYGESSFNPTINDNKDKSKWISHEINKNNYPLMVSTLIDINKKIRLSILYNNNVYVYQLYFYKILTITYESNRLNKKNLVFINWIKNILIY